MALTIIRSEAEIQGAWNRSQKAAFDAEDAGDSDDVAEAVYEFIQWLTGSSDSDPTAEMGEGDDE